MSEERNSSGKQELIETRRDYAGVRVQILASVFNRNISDELIRVFKDSLERFPTKVMSKAFVKAEQELERFPSPKLMQTICRECLPSNAWMYDYRKKQAHDPETGMAVTVLTDPVSGEELFRPYDCPEGRAFLVLFNKLARKRAA